ncbi:MAG TPA: universal stress protein [Nitrosomonas sp.]|jgi:nucleotide-binding universal stress UspA family protein|nr:universal stress protein [Nitrosomonas sp.]MDO8333552.1 universal stress protein [Nitrosomonas sp.]HQV87808.1 universal stress protein [Nitrosomonas sp.]HRB96335.1 universal stress protein [Nitrosomonas sp.]
MYQRILVPIDGSATSERALDEAIKFAQQQNSRIELVHVLEDIWYFDNENYLNYAELVQTMRYSGEKILAQAQNKFLQAGVMVDIRLLEAQGERVANVIINEAKNSLADLIIIGTHGRSGFSRMLMGSIAEGVVRMAHIPILLIRGG